ncbi:MAG: ComF family protein [Parasporobacterium sp.]|nr:ComF family protein [Parasporobacterium sp.]
MNQRTQIDKTGKDFWKQAGDRAVSLLFPRVCPLCGRILPTAPNNLLTSENNPYICRDCYRELHFPAEPLCLLCSRPIQDETKEYCRDCAATVHHFDQGKALLMHDEAAKKILYDLKYYNRRDNALMLAREAADRLEGWLLKIKPDVIIPVPLHKKRQLERGYNQAQLLSCRLSEILSSRKIHIPVDSRFLVRIKKTSAQKQLQSAQRRDNIKGAFEISYREDPGKYTNCSVLLVDDIYTTGTTLSECAQVLKEAGAGKVFFLTFSIG